MEKLKKTESVQGMATVKKARVDYWSIETPAASLHAAKWVAKELVLQHRELTEVLMKLDDTNSEAANHINKTLGSIGKNVDFIREQIREKYDYEAEEYVFGNSLGDELFPDYIYR